MPFALLLMENQKLARGFDPDTLFKTLASWGVLVSLEEQLVRRARVGFLVRWFGPSLPTESGSLRVGIANFAELQARYREVMLQAEAPPSSGPNLTEPLAGFAGTLAGMLSAPINSIFVYEMAQKIMEQVSTGLLATLNVLTLGLLGSLVAAIIGGLGGVGGLLALPGALTMDKVRVVYDLLGAVAEMADPFRRFWLIVSGPRDSAHVQNPLLLEMLRIGDSLATLVPHLMVLIALAFARIGPLIDPLVKQFGLLMALTAAVLEVVTSIFEDLLSRLLSLFQGPHTLVSSVDAAMDLLLQLVPAIQDGLFRSIGEAMFRLRDWADRALRHAEAWLSGALPRLRDLTINHPVINTFIRLSKVFEVVSGILARIPPPPPPAPPSGIFGRAWAKIKSEVESGIIALITAKFGPMPSWPAPFEPPDVDETMTRARGPLLPFSLIEKNLKIFVDLRETGVLSDPFALDDAALRKLQQSPASVFGPERRALARAGGGKPLAEQVASAHREELGYRNLIFEIVGRLLPEEAARQVVALRPILERADAALRLETPGGQAPPFPVLTPAVNDRLKPVIRRLKVRVLGGSRPVAEEWVVGLKSALTSQSYLAPITP